MIFVRLKYNFPNRLARQIENITLLLIDSNRYTSSYAWHGFMDKEYDTANICFIGTLSVISYCIVIRLQ